MADIEDWCRTWCNAELKDIRIRYDDISSSAKVRLRRQLRAVIEKHVRPMAIELVQEAREDALAYADETSRSKLVPAHVAVDAFLTPLLSQKDEAAPWIDTGGVTSHPKDKSK